MESLIASASSQMGFPIRGIANVNEFLTSTNYILPDSFKGSVIYITGCGGGGGGSGVYWGSVKAGGVGGQGSASAFRLPLAAKAGDSISIVIGASGVRNTTYADDSNRERQLGGDGGDTVIRNETAIAENRYNALTLLMSEIKLYGGGGGSHNVTLQYGAYVPSPVVQPKSQEHGLAANWQDIGFWLAGGDAGKGEYQTVYQTSNNVITGWKAWPATEGSRVLSQEYVSPINAGSKDGGGGGGSLFAVAGYGIGGVGSNTSNSNATDGTAGFCLVEWD